MTRFIDEYAPAEMPGYPCMASPRFSTNIVTTDSGGEQANQNWAHPLWRFALPKAIRDTEVFEAVKAHFLVMAGPARTWPFRNPLDFATAEITAPPAAPAVTALDQRLADGDGIRTTFPLLKTYARGATTYAARIYLPVVSSVLVSVDGVAVTTGWTVTRTAGPSSGALVFDTAPAPGAVVRWGGYYDVEVRFEADDSLDAVLQDLGAAGAADLTLVNVRPC